MLTIYHGTCRLRTRKIKGVCSLLDLLPGLRGTTAVAKFLRIGVHHSNVSGFTSKAWSVRRVGPNVFLSWGAVEVLGASDKRRIYWTIPPRRRIVRCNTEERAIAYVKRAISRRLSPHHQSGTRQINRQCARGLLTAESLGRTPIAVSSKRSR
jgi:hypothetical protein